jgi:pimeloyl-ACP methyl ester carboxylesterase
MVGPWWRFAESAAPVSSTTSLELEIVSPSSFTADTCAPSMETGQEAFLEAGWSGLQPERPGYGCTALAAGPDPAASSDRIAGLCRGLGFGNVCAVGISGGGPTGMTFAANHPEIVRGAVFERAVCFEPWPDTLTRIGGRSLFSPILEGGTWATTRAMLRLFPGATLRFMMRSLPSLPPSAAVRRMSAQDRTRLVVLLSRMRSSHGFVNDPRPGDAVAEEIPLPALVLASRNDSAAPTRHAHAIAESIARSSLVWVDTDSHFLWFGPDADAIHAHRIGRSDGAITRWAFARRRGMSAGVPAPVGG